MSAHVAFPLEADFSNLAGGFDLLHSLKLQRAQLPSAGAD